MKIYKNTMISKMKILAFAIILIITSNARADFIENEERYFIATVKKHMELPKVDISNQRHEDKKLIKFGLDVYGRFFGSSGILACIDYYLYLEKNDLENTEECKSLKAMIIDVWGRKSALTILANSSKFSVEVKEEVLAIAQQIEGGKWEDLQNDSLYKKSALFWNDISQLKNSNISDLPQLFIDKYQFSSDNPIEEIPICVGIALTCESDRVKISHGTIASFDMSLYTDLSVDTIRKDLGLKSAILDNHFGGGLFVWRDGEKEGIVQIISGKTIRGPQKITRDIFIHKSNGLDRPIMTAAVGKLEDDDLQVLAMRGVDIVDEFARKINYNSLHSMARFGDCISADGLLKVITEKGEDISELEAILLIYANILPNSSEVNHGSYNTLVNRYRK